MSPVDQIANAVLYEGYILYPYRPSTVKNRQRWNFGVIYPRDYVGALQGWDSCTMQTECLVRGTPLTALQVRVKFLHIMNRRIAAPPSSDSDSGLQFVEAAEIDGALYQSWQEAIEREIVFPVCRVSEIAEPRRQSFQFQSCAQIEEVKSRAGEIAGFIQRQNELIEGVVELTVREAQNGLYQVTASISNLTALADSDRRNREGALLRSMVSTHTILSVMNGEFLSLLDPPEEFREASARCRNVGTWPVLVGEKGQRDSMLSSPIILYDYPEIAPESPGDLFDGTEIDEILTLRIMTMTDQEKNEMRRSDERARRILERTEALPPEHLAKLHGALRGLRTVR